MYRLKSVARRSTFFGAAVAVFAATALPATQTFAAIALNPLTERSLLLSSSAPGHVDTDGSGYSTASPNPAVGSTPTYAPAGTGPNGKKTGQTFTFRTSSTADVHGFTFQYCTTAAGDCQAPGNNAGDARSGATTPRQDNPTGWANQTSDLNVTGGANVFTQSGTLLPGAGEFQISVADVATTADDWEMTTTNAEDPEFVHDTNARLTGKNNFISLSSDDGQNIAAGTAMKIEFKASEDRYITNPGSGSFFVKINSLDADGDVIDGGVTVANVMTDSIHITTKVLETMAFSVGVQNPDAENIDPDNPANAGRTHATCGAIQMINNNRLNLGNEAAEFSLETGRAWDVASYWRLSSNSSGGASVYYSGDTLHNTVNDSIASIGTSSPNGTLSMPGTEQFGLAFYDDETVRGEASESFEDAIALNPTAFQLPTIEPLAPEALYGGGEGNIGQGVNGETIDARFSFDENSVDTPALIAQNNPLTPGVLRCATAKMRYVGNIAASTPAGVYTTKINYLAAPKY